MNFFWKIVVGAVGIIGGVFTIVDSASDIHTAVVERKAEKFIEEEELENKEEI